jgi:hypothetical protein
MSEPFDEHTRLWADEIMSDRRVARRLSGEPHRHHSGCIHNLTPDEQIAIRGRTRAWWDAMGLAEPVQITPDEWQ